MNFFGVKILVIDDDSYLAEMIRLVFEEEGADVKVADNGKTGLHAFFTFRPHIVILDVVMPEMNGWDTCRQIRLIADTPILMLTTLTEDQDVVRGLDYGADDFISKPFNTSVLKARVTAVLRRAKIDFKSPQAIQNYADGYLSVDIAQRQVMVAGKPVKLSSTEFKLLSFMLLNANRVLSYEQILVNVWGAEYSDSIDYAHVYISHLRRKIEKDSRDPHYLKTEHGIGYCFVMR